MGNLKNWDIQYFIYAKSAWFLQAVALKQYWGWLKKSIAYKKKRVYQEIAKF